MIEAIIIDDEKNIRDLVYANIQNYFKNDIEVVAQAANVKEGILLANDHQPNLLFLDIELPDGTSFDILRKITYSHFQIIFITGFNKHAIKAIKVGALDYILKPVDDDEFIEATKKAIKKLGEKKDIKNLINVSSDFFKGKPTKKIVLKTLKTHHIVNEIDILYCKAGGMYTTFYLKNSVELVISKPIKMVDELLSESVFLKCHQSYIVNKEYVVKYQTQGFLILQGNHKVPVAFRRKDYVLQSITKNE